MARNEENAVDVAGIGARYFEKEVTQAANGRNIGILSKEVKEWVIGGRGGIRRTERGADGFKDGVVVVVVSVHTSNCVHKGDRG